MQATVYKRFLVSAWCLLSWDDIWRSREKDLLVRSCRDGVLIGVIYRFCQETFWGVLVNGLVSLSDISVFLFAGLAAWEPKKIRQCLWSNKWSTLLQVKQYDGFGTLSDFLSTSLSNIFCIFGRNDSIKYRLEPAVAFGSFVFRLVKQT